MMFVRMGLLRMAVVTSFLISARNCAYFGFGVTSPRRSGAIDAKKSMGYPIPVMASLLIGEHADSFGFNGITDAPPMLHGGDPPDEEPDQLSTLAIAKYQTPFSANRTWNRQFLSTPGALPRNYMAGFGQGLTSWKTERTDGPRA